MNCKEEYFEILYRRNILSESGNFEGRDFALVNKCAKWEIRFAIKDFTLWIDESANWVVEKLLLRLGWRSNRRRTIINYSRVL